MAQHMPQRNWWQRNWKWVVPVGGLTLLAGFALMVFGIMSLVFGMLSSSAPYQHALSEARGSAAVVAALGQPIETGFMTTGSISTRNDEGEATLTIPLKGPNGAAELHVDAVREAGRWDYRTLSVRLADGTAIDLLDGNPASGGHGDDERIRRRGEFRKQEKEDTELPDADY